MTIFALNEEYHTKYHFYSCHCDNFTSWL